MPQLQVFFLAVPASVLIGMLILAGSLGVMMGSSSTISAAISESSSVADSRREA